MKSHYLPEWNAFIRYYDLAGEGEPVVYLAGLSFSVLGSMLSVATHPKLRDRRALLIDYLGSGFSDHPEDFGYTMEDHAKTVASVLDNEGLTGVTVVGHSMGGTVGILLAMARPDLVSRLIVGEGNVTSGGGAATREIAAFNKDEYVDRVFPETAQKLRQSAIEGDAIGCRRNNLWATADPAGLHGNSTALVGIDDSLLDAFLKLSIPRAFLYGEKTLPGGEVSVGPDAPDPDKLKEHGISVGVIPDAGHGQMFDNLEGFVDVVSEAMN